MENQPLATELIKELRSQSKRWFVISILELVIIIAIVYSFTWYLTIPRDTDIDVPGTTIEMDAED